MPTEADVAVVRRFYAALADGDLAAPGKCFREDAVWHLPDASRIARTHRGWPAIRDDFLATLSSLSGGTFRAPVLELAVGTEYIVAVGKGIAEHAGRRLDVTVYQLMRVQDGKIVRGARPLLGSSSAGCVLGDLISCASRPVAAIASSRPRGRSRGHARGRWLLRREEKEHDHGEHDRHGAQVT